MEAIETVNLIDVDVPLTPKRKILTRDQRRDVLLMRSLGYKMEDIAVRLGVIFGAVRYTCDAETATPQTSRRGRHSILTED